MRGRERSEDTGGEERKGEERGKGRQGKETGGEGDESFLRVCC